MTYYASVLISLIASSAGAINPDLPSEWLGYVPLELWYSAERGDHFATATAAGIATAQEAGYTFVRIEGFVLPAGDTARAKESDRLLCTARQTNGVAEDCLVALNTYWNPTTQDNWLSASETSPPGYTFIRVEGYALSNSSTSNGSVPYLQWSNGAHHYITGTADGAADAKALGFTEMYVEARYYALNFVWPSTPPPGCPFAPSTDITGLEFTGLYAYYPQTNADTWYPSWAYGDTMFSSFTDGCVEGRCCGSGGAGANTGNAIVQGSDPLHLNVTNLGCQPGSPLPYAGRYPSANLWKDGVWYYGTYSLDNLNGYCGNWCVMGPFVGFRYSVDNGNTWTLDASVNVSHNVFQEPIGHSVKFGAPHFVDFGENQQYSPDGKAYVVATGCDADLPAANCSWISGDSVYMARVSLDPSAPGAVNDIGSWEFFGGLDNNGQPVWVDSVSASRPLFDWPTNTGVVTMTYHAAIKKYLMVVTTPTVKPFTVDEFDTYVVEADTLTGPFRLVVYMSGFGRQGYFVHFPSMFLDATGSSGYLMYSADFTGNQAVFPPGGRYGLCLTEVLFLRNATRH